MSVTGLGPHGEHPTKLNEVSLSPIQSQQARDQKFRIAVVYHTTSSDWSKQSLKGLMNILSEHDIIVDDIIDCQFTPQLQIDALTTLSKRSDIDAVISIPIGNLDVIDAHRHISESGKKLILHDSVPTGLLPGRDYSSFISSDNFHIGTTAAEILSPHIPHKGAVGILTFGTDFYATNEREISFGRWFRSNRPDTDIITTRFHSLKHVKVAAQELIENNPQLSGIFVVWDVPAMDTIVVIDEKNLNLPLVTVDLSQNTANALSNGHHVIGVVAQNPYIQGEVVARTTILSLLERAIPSWIAIKGSAVTKDNVEDILQTIKYDL